ncbi:E1-like protein-activating [Piedraia hortae CBS 480.64]|uniref:Ubiquitin-like modifier-activating enzyme ATG7 n=1 Tax=Piedraia hortae CBS 480.64 TaxID=1314780 RepID=A0A6A7C7B8_9PEZI|nr:E1-like protein-activating [Piedraia hortae CBS 480.64]
MSLQPIQYAPWQSDVELAFCSALASSKVNHDKLDSSARKVLGLYEVNHKNPPERSTRMQIHASALTADESPRGYYRAEGLIRNYNTMEEYRHVDKSAHIERAGKTIRDAINDGTIYSCPSLLSSFSAVCFVDLKKYKFSYHFAFPCIHSDPPWKAKGVETGGVVQHLGSRETEALVDVVQTWRYGVDSRQHGFFLAKRIKKEVLEAQWRQGPGRGEVEEEPDDDGNMNMAAQRRRKSRTLSLGELGFLWQVAPLAEYENGFFNSADEADRFVCFADPSTYPANPAWPLRNLLVLVRQKWKLDKVQVLCYRDVHVRREHPTSLILQLESSGPTQQDGQFKVTGWERNEQNKVMSKTIDLAAYIDPLRLADQAVDLNLKLIKWRISPHIDLDIVKNTSCLLLGAGTLGSYVARVLMGWGVRNISFVDNGRVSYSNPVRQPLYDFKDCENGGANKAERAADVLAEIFPGVYSHGYNISVPMVGHAVTDEEKMKHDFEILKGLIASHDAIFLLLDSREARWLPTVMAKSLGKIVINAALGFDTYVVMRHGLRPNDNEEELGCYFCSDVVAPADSMTNATLDQQCTVTRPGAAPLASAFAVELLVSIVQHELKARAPAPPAPISIGIQSPPPTDPSIPGSHPLGTVPHQLRGYMSTWQTIPVTSKAYNCCAACSPAVVAEYARRGWEFVKRAMTERGWVEELSGLAQVQREAEAAEKEIEILSDDEAELV